MGSYILHCHNFSGVEERKNLRKSDFYDESLWNGMVIVIMTVEWDGDDVEAKSEDVVRKSHSHSQAGIFKLMMMTTKKNVYSSQ